MRGIPWIVLLLCASMAGAGELKFKWDPPAGGPTPTGYRVSWGPTSPPTNEVDVGNVLDWTKSDYADCATTYLSVEAYAGPLESLPSTEISSYPRPDVTNVLDSEVGTQEVIGTNFDVNLKVFIDAGSGMTQLPSGSVTRVSCTKILIPDVPLLQVQVANVALPLGSGEPKDIFSQPWPGPTASVE